MMNEMGLEMDRRIANARVSGAGGAKKVRVRIPETEKLHWAHFSGDKTTDKKGLVTWRSRLEMHIDAVWPGMFEV